jgi:hypothetical protein
MYVYLESWVGAHIHVLTQETAAVHRGISWRQSSTLVLVIENKIWKEIKVTKCS